MRPGPARLRLGTASAREPAAPCVAVRGFAAFPEAVPHKDLGGVGNTLGNILWPNLSAA